MCSSDLVLNQKRAHLREIETRFGVNIMISGDATLGGHNTGDVADTVHAFLENLPAGYPDRLRNITLQSAEELFRATDIVKQP